MAARSAGVSFGRENSLHWVFDVAFREDAYRLRKGHAARNMAVLRRTAHLLLRRNTRTKLGVEALRRHWTAQLGATLATQFLLSTREGLPVVCELVPADTVLSVLWHGEVYGDKGFLEADWPQVQWEI